MLSPGKWHLMVPKDPEKNLILRLAVLREARKSEQFRRGLMEMCRQDILFFINLFIVQINPELREKGPFVTWPYQDVAIIGGDTEIGGEKVFQHGILACVEDRKDVRWPKSREGGASWVVLMTIVWLCIFHENIAAGAISRDEDSVDKIDDPNSLFEKVRVMLRHLPDWMKGEVKSKKLSFLFANGNTFVGEANVSSANVGGRLTILLIDEFGQFDKNGEWIYDFTRDVCKCRVFVFTHKDQSGMAYRLCYDAKFINMREIMTHWSQHPGKNQGLYRYNEEAKYLEFYWPGRGWRLSPCYDYGPTFDFVMKAEPTGGPCPGIRSPWYDAEAEARNERDVRMNLDIDPRGASDKFFDAYRIQVLKAEWSCPPLWVGNLVYSKEGYPQRLEYSPEGQIKLWVLPKGEAELPMMRAGAAVDVSAGSGYSPSCLSVGNARTGEKVAEYANANIFAPDFATFVVAFLRMIRDEKGTHPLLAWEIQGSSAFAKRVLEQLYYSPVHWLDDDVRVWVKKNAAPKAGWNPSPKSILTLMEEYRDALYQQRLINRSAEALDETLNFIYTSTSVEYRARGKRQMDGSGAAIHHGDQVRADALMYRMIKAMGFEGIEEEVKRREVLDPRTFDGRVKLAEKRWAEEEDEVWQ